jgi:hypothetical protein
MENIIKKGRGRPKGATSTVEITLSELLAKVGNNPAVTIHVGRKWINKFDGVQITASHIQDGDELPHEIQNQLDESQKIEFTITR